jgi:hypothetical protein
VIKKLSIGFVAITLAVASAATTYRVTLFQPSVINGTELKPGEYKVEIKNDKAVLWQGKDSTEVPVKIESTDQKNRATAVRYGSGSRVEEIRIGGTKTKLVF